jgi:hypothetical protein
VPKQSETKARVFEPAEGPRPVSAAPVTDAGLREAARAYLDAEAEPAYSWVIESQQARHEGRPNREVERMDRIARARVALEEALSRQAEKETA